MYMTFFLHNGNASRTEPLGSYDAALTAARSGPSGARFFISYLAENMENDRQLLEGFVS